MSSQRKDNIPFDVIVDENKRLKRAVEELTILNDLARAIGAVNTTDEIMQILVHRSIRAIGTEQGVITLVDSARDESMKTLIRRIVSSGEQQPFHLHQHLLGWMHLNKKPLLINETQNDPRFTGTPWDKAITSLLSVPLMVKSKLIGILTVYNKKDGAGFTESDQRLLAIIGAQSAQIIENARLYEEEKELLYMQHELEVAAHIQKVLLPEKIPSLIGYDMAGRNITAQLVGGDYFDFIPLDDHRMAVCIGDVSGKGLSAALLMANFQATLRSQTTIIQSVKDIIERANHLLVNCTDNDRFVTCFFGVLDTISHTLRYCNAGHDPPMLLKDRILKLRSEDLVLGVFDNLRYTECEVTIDPGDVLVLYSDGVTESKSIADEEFGEERLSDCISAHRSRPAQAILDAVIKEVCSFGGNCPQSDDITVMVVKRAG
jgi:phosphoserine phosphatase RsbU/P